MKRALLLVGLLVCLLLTGCPGGLPAPKTINDTARALCAIVMGEKEGITPEEAARTICSIPEILAPFLRETQAGAEKASQEASAAKAAKGK